MPYSEELGREYTKKEARLWREAKHAAMSTHGGMVRLIPLAQGYGWSEQHIGQIGRTWENEGLCVTTQSGRVIVSLSEFGRQFTFEERYRDIEA